MSHPIDLAFDHRWHDLFYGTPDEQGLARLSHFLRDDPNALIRLYHGTWAGHPIAERGLLPTTKTRRNSLQSSAGFVYLSVFPEAAFRFGSYAATNRSTDAQGNAVAVWAVTVSIRSLKPDADQLRNHRMFAGGEAADTLAHSLAFGSSARTKGRIPPISLYRVGVWKRGEYPNIEAHDIDPWRYPDESMPDVDPSSAEALHIKQTVEL